MNNYVYIIGNKIYINLTNRCSNNCDFCIRQGREGMADTPLWIKNEPTAEDVIEMMLAGASAVQIGAANLVNPYVCKEIIEKLPSVMEKYNIKSLSEIIGGAHNG